MIVEKLGLRHDSFMQSGLYWILFLSKNTPKIRVVARDTEGPAV